jgi:hypothetical protein
MRNLREDTKDGAPIDHTENYEHHVEFSDIENFALMHKILPE